MTPMTLNDADAHTCLCEYAGLAMKPMSCDDGSRPPSSDIGTIACDLQRSVNILSLLLDAAADDADDANAHTIH